MVDKKLQFYTETLIVKIVSVKRKNYLQITFDCSVLLSCLVNRIETATFLKNYRYLSCSMYIDWDFNLKLELRVQYKTDSEKKNV